MTFPKRRALEAKDVGSEAGHGRVILSFPVSVTNALTKEASVNNASIINLIAPIL